jgi:hypothetical protein
MASTSTTALITLALAAGLASVAVAGPDKQRPVRADRAAPAAVAAPTDAPKPPAELLKKTQPPELKDNPARKEIKAVEDLIYQMEKPGATLWYFLDDLEGRRTRDVDYVARQLADLDGKLAALRAASPGWGKLADYDARIAHLRRAHAAQRAYYGAVADAREAAADAAEAAADAAWASKRATDDGIPHAFHRASVGRIVFAGRDLDPADGSPPAVTKVAVEAPLFARAYFAESPWNTLHTAGVDCSDGSSRDGNLRTTITVNGGEERAFGTLGLDEASFRQRTSVAGSKHGSFTAGGAFTSRDDEGRATFTWITSIVPALREGDNQVRLKMYAWCPTATWAGVPIAEGTLTVTATRAGLEAVAKRASFTMSPSVHRAAALAAVRRKLTTHFGGRDYDLLDLRSASEWRPVRHPDNGAILHRALEAVALLRKRGTVGCELASVELQEPYDGRGYGPALDLGFASLRPFPCTIR